MQNGNWLNKKRIQAYWRLYLAVVGVFFCLSVCMGGSLFGGHKLGADFVTFWVAGQQVWHGAAAMAYEPLQHQAAINQVFPNSPENILPFFYPPPLLFLCAAVGWLPYTLALVTWCLVGCGLLTYCLKRTFSLAYSLPILLAPACLMNSLNGQTGVWTALCFAVAMWALPRRPALGGMALGFLIIKPHFGLSLPFLLIIAGLWRTLGAAVLTAAFSSIVSWWVFGGQVWSGFWHYAPAARMVLTQNLLAPEKITTVFGAARMVGLPVNGAFALQFIATIGVLWLLCVGVRRATVRAALALTVAAAPLCTPYVVDYDLVCLLVPLVWLVAEAQKTQWLTYEKTLIFLLYVSPIFLRDITIFLHLPVAVVFVGLPFALVLRRIKYNTVNGAVKNA